MIIYYVVYWQLCECVVSFPIGLCMGDVCGF